MCIFRYIVCVSFMSFAFVGKAFCLPKSIEKIQPYSTLVVNEIINLNGELWRVPDNVIIKFKKEGKLINGTIIGDNTSIRAKKYYKKIFENVIIEGTWQVDKVYSGWMDCKDGQNNTRQIRNLFALCDDNVNNKVFIEEGVFRIDGVINGSPEIVLIPSLTSVHNKATFVVNPHTNKQSFLFYFKNVNNCSWDGGVLIGDADNHRGNEGEQGYGIALRGASNIIIKNVVCRLFWGDGINLQYYGRGVHNRNIVIDNVLFDSNRRQGVSVEDGINISIKNSNFHNTGHIRGVSPMAGIDMEPCYKTAIVSNVNVSYCSFYGNKGGGIRFDSLKDSDGIIGINNCEDKDGGLRFANCQITSKYGISIDNYHCPGGKILFKGKVNNIKISNSIFMSILTITADDSLENVLFKNTTFETSEKITWNYYCISLECERTKNVVFDKCRFILHDDSTLISVFSSRGDWSGVRIVNSEVIDEKNPHPFIP